MQRDNNALVVNSKRRLKYLVCLSIIHYRGFIPVDIFNTFWFSIILSLKRQCENSVCAGFVGSFCDWILKLLGCRQLQFAKAEFTTHKHKVNQVVGKTFKWEIYFEIELWSYWIWINICVIETSNSTYLTVIMKSSVWLMLNWILLIVKISW